MPTATTDRSAAEHAADLLWRFDRAVEAASDRTAVVAGGQSLTFGQLARRVDRMAGVLRARGAGRGSVVAVSLPRCTDLLATLLATWRTGAAYLPLDPAHPPRRSTWMMADAGASLVVTDRRGRGLPCRVAVVALDDVPTTAGAEGLDGIGAGAIGPPAAIPGDDPAYVIYTSGSSGHPKGVLVSRDNVARLVHALEQAGLYQDEPGVVGWNASALFDASVQQWARVCRGDTIVLLPEELRTEPQQLAAFVRAHGVTDLDATPSHWEALHDDLVARGEGEPALRLLLGGEAVPEPLWANLAAARRAGTVEAVNVYGPTECTVDATAAAIVDDGPHIGRALPGTRAYVLDDRLRPLGPGEAGELYLAGWGVAHGYVNRPGLTAERFVSDPFGPPGARMYRTGDRVRTRADGTLEYLGRADAQVKLDGHRIEPGEIEAVLARHQQVSRAVVVLRDVPGAGRSLVAYHTPVRDRAPATAEALRGHAAASLPPVMVPGAYMALDGLPLTVSGKVDQAALPDPPAARSAAAGHERCDTAIERAVAESWAAVLGAEEIALEDDFFALGGHSLQALRLGARLKKLLGVAVPTRLVYKHPRLRDYTTEVAALAAGADRLRTTATTGGAMTTTDTRPAGETTDRLLAGTVTGPMPAVQLARRYDAGRLRDELAALGTSPFTAQRSFDRGAVVDGELTDWRVLPLRSPGGDPNRTDPGGPGLLDYAYTPHSRRAPYMTSLLEDLPVALRSARLMSLAPGAEVDEHRDVPYGLPAGWFRLHVPIVTNPGAVLVIDGVPYRWQPGTLWYGDFGRPHHIYNEGDSARVHLVVDCYVNRRLLELFPEEFRSRMPWSQTLFDREEVPLPAREREAMVCEVMVPASFLTNHAHVLPAPPGTPDVPGRVKVLDDRLVLEIDDGTEMALVHIGEGEFRPLCWTTERTVKLDFTGDAPVVRFRLRFGAGLSEYVRPALLPAHQAMAS